MSDKNKIAIIFEALGVDKVIASLKNLTVIFSKTDKDIKDISKSTKTFDDSISKLAQSSTKTGVSFKTVQKEQDNYNKGVKENIADVKEQEETYSSLKKVLDEQKEAYNSLIKEALSQTEIKIADITAANNSYIDTLNELKKEYGETATKSSEFNDIQKEIAGSIKIAKEANKELKTAVESGNTSFKNIEGVVKKTTKALEEQNTTIGKLKKGFSDFALSGGDLLKSIGNLVPGIMGVKLGFDALNKTIGSTMQMAYDNSEKMRKSIENMKEYSNSVIKPLNDGFKLLGDTIANYVLKPLERDFQVAFINSGEAAKKTDKIIEESEKAKAKLLKEHEEEKKKIRETYNLNTEAHIKEKNKRLEAEELRYNEALVALSKNSVQKKEEQLKSELKKLEEVTKERDRLQKNSEIIGVGFNEFGDYKDLDKANEALKRQQEIVDKLKKSMQENTTTGNDALEKSMELERNAFNASLKTSREKEKTLAEQVKYLYEYKDIQIKIINETVASESERAKKIKQLDQDTITQKISLYESSYKKIIENDGKIVDSSIASTALLQNEIIASKNFLSELDKKVLDEELMSAQKVYDREAQLITLSVGNQKDANDMLKENDRKMYEEKLKLLEDAAREQIANGNDISKVNVENMGTLEEAIKKTREELDKLNGKTKTVTEQLKDKAGEIVGALGSIAGSINSLIQSSKKAQLESLAEYETAIDAAAKKQKDELEEFDKLWKESQDKKKEEKEAMDEEENAAYIERLESEMQRSLEAGDILSASAIRHKLEELEAEKKKKEAEKEMKKKEKIDEDKMKEDRAKLEKQLNYDLAMAEYNKAMAEHNNQIKLAETEAQKAKADASISLAQGIAQAAVGVATSVAQLGPIAGLALGLTTAASITGSVVASTNQVKSASDNLESLKSSPPKPPKFQYGTSGYSLAQGESAIVGEAGAEIVRNRGGLLEVESTERTKNKGAASGEVNVNINVYGMMFSEAIETIQEKVQETFLNMKERSLNYAI